MTYNVTRGTGMLNSTQFNLVVNDVDHEDTVVCVGVWLYYSMFSYKETSQERGGFTAAGPDVKCHRAVGQSQQGP